MANNENKKYKRNEFTQYIHCNNCFAKMGSTVDSDHYRITRCGRVLCYQCCANCYVCPNCPKNMCESVPLSVIDSNAEKNNSDLFFCDMNGLLKVLVKVNQFQCNQRQHLFERLINENIAFKSDKTSNNFINNGNNESFETKSMYSRMNATVNCDRSDNRKLFNRNNDENINNDRYSVRSVNEDKAYLFNKMFDQSNGGSINANNCHNDVVKQELPKNGLMETFLQSINTPKSGKPPLRQSVDQNSYKQTQQQQQQQRSQPQQQPPFSSPPLYTNPFDKIGNDCDSPQRHSTVYSCVSRISRKTNNSRLSDYSRTTKRSKYSQFL